MADLVMGVDPGLNGALAICDARGELVEVWDIPTWSMLVGKKKRKRVDEVALLDMIDFAALMGVGLVILEGVAGGRQGQSQSSGYSLGYVCGLLYMGFVQRRVPIETVPAATWKKIMGVPGKAATKAQREEVAAVTVLESEEAGAALKKTQLKAAEAAIIKRADEVFPDHRARWRGPRGGFALDRAEASLMARFGVIHVLKSLQPDLSYRKSDVGA